MWMSISVKQVDGPRSYELRLDLGEAGVNVSSMQQRSTAAALLGYFDEKARTDQELSDERTHHLRYRQDAQAGGETTEKGGEQEASVSSAELMGRRIRDIGDEFMARIYTNPRLSSYVDRIVNEEEGQTDTQGPFEHFCEVVNIVLQCDETGEAQMISIGRIAALFSYCYHLCKVFIVRKGLMGVVNFLGQLLGYLIRSLHRSRFYEWLSFHGGWTQLLKLTYHNVPVLSTSPYLATPAIICGVVLLGYMAYRYYRNV